MFAKTVCKPGSYLAVVPVGLLITLQYNSKGVLEKILQGYGDKPKDITDSVFDRVKELDSVPISIPITAGTTWIQGVLYTDTLYTTTGVLPECVSQEMLKDLCKGHSFSFFAGHVESMAADFRSIIALRNWLNMSGFHQLPMYMIPAELTESAFQKILDTPKFPFKFPLISGYMIFENSEYRYHPLDLIQYNIVDSSRSRDLHGYIHLDTTDDYNNTRKYNYSDAIKYNIQKGSCVVQDEGKIVFSHPSKFKKQLEPKLTCDICGNIFVCPEQGPVTCSDENCASLIYDDVVKMLDLFGLPALSPDRFLQLIEDNTITTLSDVLLLPMYKNSKANLTLCRFLQAVVPATICTDLVLFNKVADISGNSPKTFLYYIENISRLAAELGSKSVAVVRLLSWLDDPHTAVILQTILSSEQVIICNRDKKFEGAPIFRNNQIAITGKFRHGDLLEVQSILKSYDATVTIGISDQSNCLVIGQLNENNDGRSIQYAHEHNIPTFSEDEFFARYEIDADLASNLL